MDDITDLEAIYRSFIDRLNEQDLEGAVQFVDRGRYRENCIGFTPGVVGWPEAKESLETVWRGIPDLHVTLQHVAAAGDVVLAHGLAGGTSLGRLYGAPATKRRYEASFFDSVRIDGGMIVERTQQADAIGQMRQLYGKVLGAVGVSSLLWRLR